jgi:TonB family protein
LLSASDRLALEQSLQRWRASPADGLHPVGFFRSHTRPDFGFDAQDEEMFGGGEGSAEQVFLLIRPSHTELPLTQIGIRVGDRFTAAATFPLSVPALEAAGLLLEDEAADHPAGTPEIRPNSEAQVATVPQKQSRNTRWVLAGSAATIAVAVLALTLSWPRQAGSVKAPVRPAAVLPAPALPDSEKAAAAVSGDPQTGDVQEAKAPQEGAAESAPEPVWRTPPRQASRDEDGDEPPPRSKWVVIPQPSVPQTAAPQPLTTTQSPAPQPSEPPQPAVERAARPVRAESRIDSSVSTDPVRPSRAGRILKTLVPLRWTGFTSGTHTTSARAITQVKPSIPPALAKRAHSEEVVDVKVQVLADGHVSRAEVTNAPQNSLLAEPARVAAEQWVFEPARVANRPVASSVVIHFRFRENQSAF